MKFSIVKILLALGALTVVSACAQTPSVTRNAMLQEIGQERALTQLSRQFMSQAPYTVNFAFDDYALDEAAKARLDKQAAWIMARPDAKFSVYGHTDLMGSDAYNQKLGLERAQMVVDYLIGKGISASRLEVKMTVGESMPLVNVVGPNDTNRRATTFVSGWMKVAQRDRREERRRAARDADRKPVNDDQDTPVCLSGDGCNDGDDGDDQSHAHQHDADEHDPHAPVNPDHDPNVHPCLADGSCGQPEQPDHEVAQEA